MVGDGYKNDYASISKNDRTRSDSAYLQTGFHQPVWGREKVDAQKKKQCCSWLVDAEHLQKLNPSIFLLYFLYPSISIYFFNLFASSLDLLNSAFYLSICLFVYL